MNGLQRGSVAVNGPLGMGKTSLLRYIADPDVAASHGATPPKVRILYVDIQSVTPFSADRFWHRVARLLERSGSTGVEDALRRLQSRDAIDVIDVEEFLDALAERASGHLAARVGDVAAA